MRRCPSCGKVTEDDSLDFCTHCGSYFMVRQGSAPAQPASSSLPDDPMLRGEMLMDSGRFVEGIACWRDAIPGIQLDDSAYGRVVDATTRCLLGIAVDPNTYRDAGMISFAMTMPDREPLTDIMSRLANSLDVCTIQNGVLGLANPYMYLFMDTFALYTDLRDVNEICADAEDAVGEMVEKAIHLSNAFPDSRPGPLDHGQGPGHRGGHGELHRTRSGGGAGGRLGLRTRADVPVASEQRVLPRHALHDGRQAVREGTRQVQQLPARGVLQDVPGRPQEMTVRVPRASEGHLLIPRASCPSHEDLFQMRLRLP